MTWHIDQMDESTALPGAETRITPRLIDALYTEAMVLADEARAYFDDAGRDERQTLDAFARVGFACESLKVTTRIMHIVAWLLTQKAVVTGEIKLGLYKGNIIVCSRTSPNSLYDDKIASMEAGGSYNQTDAEGFLRIMGLPGRVQGRVRPRAY